MVTRPLRWVASQTATRVASFSLALTPMAVAALVYYPITHNYFANDDFLNLYQIRNFHLFEYLIVPNGGHVQVTRNAAFYLMATLFGVHPEYYFAAVLFTHVLNTRLLFEVIKTLTSSARLASVGAVAWGISPMNEGTLGWYSVYGHVLVATALLVILAQAVRLSVERRAPSRMVRAGWFALALAAATSFGTGTAAAAILPFVLCLLLPAAHSGWRHRVPLLSLIIVVPLLYLGLLRAYEAVWQLDLRDREWLGYVQATWPLIATALFNLIAYGLTRLLLGFWLPPAALPELAYALLGAFVLAIAVTAWRASADVRRQLAAAALLLVSAYGAIAFGRLYLAAPLSSHLDSLSRYHYVGQLMLTVLLCVAVNQVRPHRLLPPWARSTLVAACYGLLLGAYVLFAANINHHRETRRQTRRALADLRATIRAAPPGEPVYIRNGVFSPVSNFVISRAGFPGMAAAFTIFFPGHTVDGHRVYFIERNARALKIAGRGRRIGPLLVPERPCEPSSLCFF